MRSVWPMPELAILVPTRGRPENIRKVISAWDFTNAWDHADLVLVADADDPEIDGYRRVVEEYTSSSLVLADQLTLTEAPTWLPMVHKLNKAAVNLAGRYFALGFAGDDHLPQTIGWAARYLTVLHELGTGMVYGDDGYQGRKLSTEWAVTSDAVRALGRMVPADVEHMYCDNAMMDLFGGAGALRHLPEIRIEHMHPYAGKAETDAQYDRVNHRDQFKTDRRAYETWRDKWKLSHVALVRGLRRGRPDVSTEPTPTPRASRVLGSGPRRVPRRVPQRSGPTSARRSNATAHTPQPPRHFKNVRAATPEDIMITLADFATQVAAHHEIVELGVFQGRTALQLAWGASMGHGAHVTAIDPWDLPGNDYGPPFTDADSRGWARHWVDTLGYADKITLIQAFSQDVAAEWVTSPDLIGRGNKPVGLLYVDGDHTREGARRDIVSWAPHLVPSARIAVDDYGHPDWPGVGEAVDELVAEGFLDPIEVYHDRLAVTRLSTGRRETPAAVTSEGVSPSPYPAMDSQVAEGPASVPDKAMLEAEWRRVDPEGVAALEESAAALAGDSEVSGEAPGLRVLVSAGELEDVAEGTEITELTIPQLKALARHRGIVLGVRKDKRDLILGALRDGK